MATLFAEYLVKPVMEKGQSEKEARNALLGMVNDSKISAITLQMQKPRKVALEWRRRT